MPAELESEQAILFEIDRWANALESTFTRITFAERQNKEVSQSEEETAATFHDEMHEVAVGLAGEKYLKKIQQRVFADDPLQVRISTDTHFEKAKYSALVQKKIVQTATRLFAFFHDKGNNYEITGSPPSAIRRIKHSAVDAEARSKLILSFCAKETSSMSNEIMQSILQLVALFIEHSIYDPKKEITDESIATPFWLYIQSIDQLGGNIFRGTAGVSAEQRQQGVLAETFDDITRRMIEEESATKPEKEIVPFDYFNFVALRAAKLLGDSANRLMEIWGTQLPPIKDKLVFPLLESCIYLDRPVTLSELVKVRKIIRRIEEKQIKKITVTSFE